MEGMQLCPACGAENPARRPCCRVCGRLFSVEAPGFRPQEAPSQVIPAGQDSLASQPAPQQFAQSQQYRFLERPQVKIVRPSQRRKFLAGALGAVATLAIASTGIGQLAQNIRIGLNTKDYPYHLWDDLVSAGFSDDLNLIAMIKVGNEEAHRQSSLSGITSSKR